MLRVTRVSVLSFLLGLSLTGPLAPRARAQHDPVAHDPTVPQPPPPPAPRTPEDEARRAHVVARIGPATITVGDVEDQISRQSPFMRARFRDPAQLRDLVDNMIRFELLAREAVRQGVGDDAEVREATSQGAVQHLVRERFDDRITPDSIPAADVDAYHAAHPEEFNRPEMRRASHVLVATRDEAVALVARLREADARTFRQVAQETSLDTESRTRGGDLRYFDATGHPPSSTEAGVAPALTAAAFALREVGDVSEPIEVEGRFSVVKLTGLRAAEHRTITESAPSIRLRLWRERRQAAIDAHIEELRTRAAPEIHEDRMRSIVMEPPEPTSGPDEHRAPEGEGQDEPSSPVHPAAAPSEADEPSPAE